MRFGSAALLFYAVSPILVHGTVLGRPDHQSLLMLTLTVAFGAELALAGKMDSPEKERRWGLVSGVAWGLSLWVSLYEPLILLAVTIGLWLALDRRAFWSRPRWRGAVVCLVILLLSLVLEGWPVALPDAAMRGYFAHWQHQIGELSHLRPVQLFDWVGWWIVASPVLLLLAWRQDRRALPLVVMLFVVTLLTLWQARWGYFLGIAFAWTLPWQMQAWRRGWVAWLFFAVGWWPILQAWDASLFPDESGQDQRDMKQAEVVALRSLAEDAIGKEGGAVSRLVVALAGDRLLVAAAGCGGQLARKPAGHCRYRALLLERRFRGGGGDPAETAVHWVLADDASREIETSRDLLGITPPPTPLATTLSDHPRTPRISSSNGPVAPRCAATDCASIAFMRSTMLHCLHE